MGDNLLNHLSALGFQGFGEVYRNLSPERLYDEAENRDEAQKSKHGPLVLLTTPHTGRLPNDRFFVKENTSADKIGWGKVNRSIDATVFDGIQKKITQYFEGKDLFVQDCYVGADTEFRLSLRVITEKASHSLFAHSMFIRESDPEKLKNHDPQFTVIQAPDFHADPAADGTNSDAFILINFEKKMVLIGGTAYSGEIKKSMFTVMNFLMPDKDVLPMHCSANYGTNEDDAAIFFGLSGTGKTTLSADPERTLVGDDEHGWSSKGVFNFEGGCYAKVIRLSKEGEPEIYATTRKFGTLLENVVMDQVTHEVDFNNGSISENTRASYPISHIPHMTTKGLGGHPKNIIMLTCDAFGILPPVARLTPSQAMYHFLSGYTAKVAGTEEGVKEPQATFSSCFGLPFMPRQPSVYAKLLGKRIKQHGVDVWLINTGWTGGIYGEGERISLQYTRSIVSAILSGMLKEIETEEDPVFHIGIPKECPDVPSEVLHPRRSWKDPEAYDKKALELVQMFKKNFEENVPEVPTDIAEAGPKI